MFTARFVVLVIIFFFFTNNFAWPHLQIVQELEMVVLRCNFLHSLCQLHRAPPTSGPMITLHSSWCPRSLCDATHQVDLCLSVIPVQKEKCHSDKENPHITGQTTLWLNKVINLKTFQTYWKYTLANKLHLDSICCYFWSDTLFKGIVHLEMTIL